MESEVITMEETTAAATSVFPASIGELTALFRKLLEAIKKFFGWLGILILPDEGEYDDYPEG